MTTALNVTSLFNGSVTPTAPLIEGTAASTLSDSGFDTSTSVGAGRYGCRVPMSPALDFTGADYATFTLLSTQFGVGEFVDTVANGGWRVIFVDGSGHYAGFNVYGGDIPNYNPSNSGVQDGYFVSFAVIPNHWHIARTRTPDISSGVLDWSNITAIEITVKTTGTSRRQASISRVCKRSTAVSTGTGSFSALPAVASGASADVLDPILFGRAPYYESGSPLTVYSSRLGLAIGDGATTTNFSESAFSFGFENTFDKSPTFRSVGPFVQLDNGNTRPLTINQSASDTLTLTDGQIGSAAHWSWALSGSGTATLTRMQFWRFSGFTAAHGTYTDCAWNGGEAPVEVTASTHITRGVIRNASHGIKINSAPGNYAALEVALDSNSTYDVQVGSGGAGTYTLTGVSVLDGAYTLKLHNDSATNAVVVELPAGILYSTSTAGGAITVSAPSTFIDASVTAITTGSRLLVVNETTGVTITNEVISGTSWSSSTALGVDFTPGDIVRVDVTFCDGATAKLPFRARAVVGSTAWSVLAAQDDDAVYNANGVDGSAVTEFTADYPHVQIDINDLDGNTTPQRGYAWYCYAITSDAGIVAYFGAMTAEDEFNYVIETDVADVKLQNVGTGSVSITGAAIRRRDGTSPIATDSGSVHLWAGRVYGLETGVSGLTGTESEMLSQAANAGNLSFSGGAVNANVAKVAGAAIHGSGTAVDPWGP